MSGEDIDICKVVGCHTFLNDPKKTCENDNNVSFESKNVIYIRTLTLTAVIVSDLVGIEYSVMALFAVGIL